jgi:hypothetical protein
MHAESLATRVGAGAAIRRKWETAAYGADDAIAAVHRLSLIKGREGARAATV